MNQLDNFGNTEMCFSPLGFDGVVIVNVIICALGLIWAYRNVKKVTNINLDNYV